VTSRAGNETSPVWSPDGAQIAFFCDYLNVPLKVATLGGQETDLPNKTTGWFLPTDWSHDGKYLLLTAVIKRELSSNDIWLYDYVEKSAKPWLATKFDESQARFSPDGRWVAYSSNSNGPLQVYIRPFRGEGRAILVSSEGGKHPAWKGDGSELFYLSPRDELMSVTVDNIRGVPKIGEPRRLFRATINDITSDIFSPYDVRPDGQRFLVNVPEPPEPMLFIQGLEEFLKKIQ
jgi:Tol biopolymer transport system component